MIININIQILNIISFIFNSLIFSLNPSTLLEKAEEDADFAKLLDRAVRRIIDYKIDTGMLYVHLDDSGKYLLSIDYQACMNNDSSVFEELKQQNRQFYMDNFYGK